ncbi:MAG: hypothetical protein HC781_06350 [Leptolyngbyaceae cyanobacterium CSU_1_4]|nr:hypothetical protein [Leptolyngbyaceae cyanobacterium CSU_1_4]
MASQQLLSLVIQAIDKASGVVNKIQGAIGGLGGSAKQAEGQAGGLSNAISFGMVKAQAAIAITQQGYAQLQGMIAESSNLQLQNMTAASTFAAMTGKSFDEAGGFIDRLNNRLAKSAAALPGATQDYATLARTIQDNVLDAFKGADGKLSDMKGFEDVLAGISESYGVLAAGSGVDIGNTGLGLSKALGGASIAELRQIQIFEQNPAVLNFLDERLKALGAKTLKDLDIKTRVALVKQAGDKFVTQEFKTRAAETVDGLLQSFKSTLFDPQTGIFGLSRDLSPETEGTQSAFTSLNKLLKNLLGGGGLFEQVSSILQSLGLTADPMQLLADGLSLLIAM